MKHTKLDARDKLSHMHTQTKKMQFIHKQHKINHQFHKVNIRGASPPDTR